MKKFLAICFVISMSLYCMHDDKVRYLDAVGSMSRKYFDKDMSAVRIQFSDGEVLFVSYDTSRTRPLLILSMAQAQLNYTTLREKFGKQIIKNRG